MANRAAQKVTNTRAANRTVPTITGPKDEPVTATAEIPTATPETKSRAKPAALLAVLDGLVLEPDDGFVPGLSRGRKPAPNPVLPLVEKAEPEKYYRIPANSAEEATAIVSGLRRASQTIEKTIKIQTQELDDGKAVVRFQVLTTYIKRTRKPKSAASGDA